MNDLENRVSPTLWAKPRPSLFRIDFTGKAHAWDKYLKTKVICDVVAKWYYDRGKLAEYYAIKDWMQGSLGFTRPHTPYFVSMPADIYKLVVAAVRTPEVEERCGFIDDLYAWLRRYGQWGY